MEERVKRMAKTPNGKEVIYKRNPRGNFVIMFTSGGELPQELQGEFTNSTNAEKAINVYLSKKQSETKSNKVDGTTNE